MLINFSTRGGHAGVSLRNRRRRALKLLSAAACLSSILSAPGTALARQAGQQPVPAGEVLVVLNEQTFNVILEAVLQSTPAPTFPLKRGGESSASSARCPSEVTLARESQGVRTAVRFTEDRRILVPLAFRGTYEASLLGCLKFDGWADAELTLEFERARQSLLGRVRVRDVRLKNLPSLLTNGVTQLVQDAIDRRFNPLEILRAEQLGARLPAGGSGGAGGPVLRLRAREVRHEVAVKELRLRVVYEVVKDS